MEMKYNTRDMTSIIITRHNEDRAFVTECLDQILSTIDIEDYEIIIVDDCSDTELQLGPAYEQVRVICNKHNVGVGRSFDNGVHAANGDNLIIMACDIRFVSNKWASRLIEEIDSHPKSFVCTPCVTLYHDDRQFDDNTTKRIGYGATILMFHDHISNPSKSKGFRSIIEAKWQASKPEESYEIPCILGAIYAVKKDWYKHVDGFWGHKQWGTLEPYISLKSWLFGGSCRIVKSIKTGHIFSRNIHNISQISIAYNKYLVCCLLLDGPLRGRLLGFLNNTPEKAKAAKLISDKMEEIESRRMQYSSNTVLSIEDYCKRFGIDMRTTNNQ